MNGTSILELLKGKDVIVMSDFGEIKLTIESISEDTKYIETGPSNQSNDWYPDGYHETTFLVRFTNGKTKRFKNLAEIKLANNQGVVNE